MNSIIEEIYRTQVVRDEFGNEYKLHSAVDRLEGEFLFRLVDSNEDIRKTLEIGCAYGLSSLYICSALSNRDSAKHIIIDPFQRETWHGVGVYNLQRAGFSFFELIEKPSEFVLPEMTQTESGTFDMVFIDGWHTFDHTLLDLFYANRLIRIGGYIVVDDCTFPSVAKAVSYMLNYPAYKLDALCPSKTSLKAKILQSVIPPSVAGYILPRNIYDRFYICKVYGNMVALKKVGEDERSWNWFEPF